MSTARLSCKTNESQGKGTRTARASIAIVVIVLVVAAVILAAWRWRSVSAAQSPHQQITTVWDEYNTARFDFDLETIQSSMGPRGNAKAERLLDAALNDGRAELRARDPDEVIAVLRARTRYSSAQLRQLSLEDFAEELLSDDGLSQGLFTIDRLEIRGDVAWARIIVDSENDTSVDGEFFANVDGDWKIEHWLFSEMLDDTFMPEMPEITMQQIEELFSDENTGVFDTRLWDGPID